MSGIKQEKITYSYHKYTEVSVSNVLIGIIKNNNNKKLLAAAVAVNIK